MTKFALKFRYLVIVLSVIIGLGGLSMLPRMETDPDIRNYIPSNMESSINTDLIEKEFGLQDMLMIVFRDSCILTPENLRRIEKTDRQIEALRSVDNTISLFNTRRIYGEQGMMIVDPAINSIPSDSEDIENLKKQLEDNPLAMGTVISDDFSMSAIAATISQDTDENIIMAEIDSVISANPGSAEVFFGGLPYIRKAIMKDVRRDGLTLIPIALVIMLAFLWLAFREWKGMVLPFTIVVLSIVFAMGLIPLLGWKISILSLIVPIMLIAVANDYGIHMIAKYQELISENHADSNDSIVRSTVRKLRLPVIFTGLTTIAGVLGLLAHAIIPARQVGVLASAGIAFAVLLTLFFLPAWLSLLPKSKPLVGGDKISDSLLDRSLARLAHIVTARPKRVILVSAVLTLIFAAGIIFIRVDGNQENFFPAKHPVKQASTLINKHFGGSQSISVMIEGDIKEPSLLKKMDRWTEEIQTLDGVGESYSIATVLREMTKALYDENEEGYDKIPGSRQAVAQILEIYNMSGDPEDFDRLVDFNYTKAHLMIRFEEPATEVIRNAVDKIRSMAENDRLEVTIGGYAYIMLQFSEKILTGQVNSLIFAIIVVLVLLSIIMRSFKGGLISTIPILASVIFLLGFMGISGIALDPATALLSSIMIGVGVDYIIHFLWRYKSELVFLDHRRAIIRTLTTTGRGIVYNALSVMVGFSVLVFSGFTSIRFFGYLVLISIGVCLISALFVIPSILLVFKPSFVEYKSYAKRHTMRKKNFKKAVVLFLLFMIPVFLCAQDFSAKEVMDKSREAMKVESFEAVASLNITDSRGNVRERSNITASKSYSDGTEKRLIKFLSPADVEGTTMLIYDYDEGQDDMWIYLPALKRTRRIVSSEKGKSFMGSEFSNADMSSPPADDFNHRILEESGDQYVIESVPVNSEKKDEYGYARKISTINKRNFLVTKMDFFDSYDEHYKTIIIEDTKEVSEGKFIIKHMRAENLINDRRSEIVMSDIRTGTQVRDELFNVSALGR
ncbi:MAG: efflux RND transporter permease subunit [Bacteroidales bacterium]|jgi:hydrophobe/amphiphile efflux-3 (HAE3) family protein|nr:efflux RND transporter permease subunit [Bacteroidales bacterium]